MPKIILNGVELEARERATIMQVADEIGVRLPRYCYHPRLSVAGCCRICLVEVEGRPRMEPSCRTQVVEGMAIHTHSPKAIRARSAQLELLLLNHPIDCPICDQAGECGLQDYYMEFGRHQSRFKLGQKVKRRKAYPIGPHVAFDAERCILCTRCVRFCIEVAKDEELGIEDRGNRSEIVTFPGEQLDNPYSINTANVCPVGALTSRDFRFKQRVWFLRKPIPSICPGCANGCNNYIHSGRPPYVNLKNYRVVHRFKPRDNEEVNQGWLCDDGYLSYPFVNEGRLLQPHVREGDELAPISWERALALVAQGIQGVLSRCGPAGFGGISSSHCTNEAHYLFRKLLREVIGTENLDFIKGRMGYEDDFLIRADKSPNSRGALDMGVQPGPGGLTAPQMLDAGNGLKGLYILGGRVDLAEAFGGEKVREAFSQMDLVVLQVSNLTEACRYAQVLLPGATFAEIEGTFTNYASRVQRLNRAFDPRGESLPDWTILKLVATAMGQAWPYENAEEVMMDIAATIPQYSRVTYPRIGDLGVRLTVNES